MIKHAAMDRAKDPSVGCTRCFSVKFMENDVKYTKWIFAVNTDSELMDAFCTLQEHNVLKPHGLSVVNDSAPLNKEAKEIKKIMAQAHKGKSRR